MTRCMADEAMQEYDTDQRAAICNRQLQGEQGEKQMERKVMSFKVNTADEATGIFTGYGSTFTNVPDDYGDVVDPGAFTKTLRDQGNRIKILWNHDVSEPIGKPLSIVQDENGLLVTGKLTPGVQRAAEVLALMKDGVINEMSIGYKAVRAPVINGVRHLQEVQLWDISLVTFAANPTARVLAVKEQLQGIEEKYGRVMSADRIAKLKEAMTHLQSLLEDAMGDGKEDEDEKSKAAAHLLAIQPPDAVSNDTSDTGEELDAALAELRGLCEGADARRLAGEIDRLLAER